MTEYTKPALPIPVLTTSIPFYDGRDQFYTADQMQAHADACVAAYKAHIRAEQVPVACPRNELVLAIHILASNFENSLYAFRNDEEALRKAKGDIAHAMKIAAKHNQNGPGCTTPQAPLTLTLTDEQIHDEWKLAAVRSTGTTRDMVLAFARAVLAAAQEKTE
jgi:hypothetical protein